MRSLITRNSFTIESSTNLIWKRRSWSWNVRPSRRNLPSGFHKTREAGLEEWMIDSALRERF